MHQVFLSQNDNNDRVIHDKFKIMVTVHLSLNINWPRVLMANMKGEIKKVDQKFNNNGLLLNLIVKRRLNLCSKISLIFLANYQQSDLPGAVEFDPYNKLPSDLRQFKMFVRINDHSILFATPMVRPFLVEMGTSNPM